LAVRLLAPTVLVSVGLMVACTAAVVYLNYLHVNVARDLTENVQSTQAAARLEATTERMIELLRGNAADRAALIKQVQELNSEAQRFLDEAIALANLEREQVLVGQIRAGLDEYLAHWQERQRQPDAARRADERLAEILEKKVLEPCRSLRHYNTDQIAQSDVENQTIVQKLRWGLLVVGVGLPLGGLIVGYVVAQSLRHSIYQLSVRIRDAAGRLNRELGSVTVEEEGDLPDLHRQMQGVTEEIEQMVKQLQQREREVLRAEQLAAVGQVAAGVAHELRNPLTSVKMLVQTALEERPGAALSRNDLGVIEQEVRRMEQCIRQFLEFAKPPKSQRRKADLTEVIRRAMALVEGRAHRQRVHLHADLPSAPVYLDIDPDQIHQVVVNLILNSLDALPRGGDVQIVLSLASADGDGRKVNGEGAEAGVVIVTVKDTGPGIAPAIMDRLFEPFVSSKESGLGLGLSICKRLVEAHGGTIEGHNRPTGGAEFRFIVPLDRSLAPDGNSHMQSGSGFQKAEA
jgi:signal transduction histidine kinase